MHQPIRDVLDTLCESRSGQSFPWHEMLQQDILLKPCSQYVLCCTSPYGTARGTALRCNRARWFLSVSVAFTHTASPYGDERQRNCAHWQQRYSI